MTLHLGSELKRKIKESFPILYDELVRTIFAALVGALTLSLAFALPFVRPLFEGSIEISKLILTAYLLLTAFVGGFLTFMLLKPKIHELASMAATDDLTKAYNRRELGKRLEEEIERAKRYRDKLSMILIDLDYLKTVNDKYGYDAGDRLLREFAELVQDKKRASDIFFRYKQGDEFAILATNTDGIGARAFAERLRLSVEAYNFEGSKPNKYCHITMSAGIAEFTQSIDTTPENLEKRAENALQTAKRKRNSVVLVQEQ
jgi:diguanylate cyclase (GGDEF)-like protein